MPGVEPRDCVATAERLGLAGGRDEATVEGGRVGDVAGVLGFATPHRPGEEEVAVGIGWPVPKPLDGVAADVVALADAVADVEL